jgi:hypothetical protein
VQFPEICESADPARAAEFEAVGRLSDKPAAGDRTVTKRDSLIQADRNTAMEAAAADSPRSRVGVRGLHVWRVSAAVSPPKSEELPATSVRRQVTSCSINCLSYTHHIERDEESFPVQYLGANVPQACAAGSVFALLQAILGFLPDAPRGRLYVDPVLPPWLPDLTVLDLHVGQRRFDIRFWREADGTQFEVLRGDPQAVKRRHFSELFRELEIG